MRPSDREIALIRRSFADLQPCASHISEAFYEDLFQRHDKIRALFPGDITNQRMKFMDAIEALVRIADDAEEMDRRINELAKMHAQFGLEPSHFSAMQDALIDTLRHSIGRRFTPGTEAAWGVFLGHVCDTMIAAHRSAA